MAARTSPLSHGKHRPRGGDEICPAILWQQENARIATRLRYGAAVLLSSHFANKRCLPEHSRCCAAMPALAGQESKAPAEKAPAENAWGGPARTSCAAHHPEGGNPDLGSSKATAA